MYSFANDTEKTQHIDPKNILFNNNSHRDNKAEQKNKCGTSPQFYLENKQSLSTGEQFFNIKTCTGIKTPL